MLSSKKIIIILGGVIVLVVAAVVAVVFMLVSRATPVTLTYWGIWEPEAVFSEVVADYHRLHPNVTIKYARQSGLQYRERVAAAVARDDSPDIVRIHDTWLPMMWAGLQSVPTSIYTSDSFRKTYYPTMASDLMVGGKPYAIPLQMDTLVLFVNQDIFNKAGLSVPMVWQAADGFDSVATKLTVRDANGKLVTSGAALGAASNVDQWQDILSLMLLQSGIDPSRELTSDKAAKALDFYTSFVTTYRTWDETMDPSTLAFEKGQVAMYFGPSWRYFDFDEYRKKNNPSLNFKVVPVPQLTGGTTVNFASYWAEGVSKKSKHSKEAWDFLAYLSSRDSLLKLYSSAAKQRFFGEIYPRRDMAPLLSADPTVGVFISEAPTAQSWYLVGATWDGDSGINSKVARYMGDAVNSVVRGGDSKSALSAASLGVSQVLQSYGITPR